MTSLQCIWWFTSIFKWHCILTIKLCLCNNVVKECLSHFVETIFQNNDFNFINVSGAPYDLSCSTTQNVNASRLCSTYLLRSTFKLHWSKLLLVVLWERAVLKKSRNVTSGKKNILNKMEYRLLKLKKKRIQHSFFSIIYCNTSDTNTMLILFLNQFLVFFLIWAWIRGMRETEIDLNKSS